jgi:hypothetical protein
MTISTKVRVQSPAVARRKMMRSVVKRANIIAKNAYNIHNSSIQRIAEFGAATSKNEFLSESMSIAWKEQKTGKTIYNVVGKIPRKSMQDIHKALKAKITQLSQTDMSTQNSFFIQAQTMILARNAGKHSDEDMCLAFEISHNIDPSIVSQLSIGDRLRYAFNPDFAAQVNSQAA